MLTSRLFWRVFLAYALMAVAVCGAFAIILSQRLETILVEHVRQELRNTAVILRAETRDAFAQGPSAELQKHLDELARETGARITLIDGEGRVIGDSAEDPAAMENHGERPEIVDARQTGEGLSDRSSSTLKTPMTYCALRVGDAEKPLGFVRAALALDAVNAEVRSVRRIVWSMTGLATLAVLAVTYFVLARIVRPVGVLTEAALAITRGELGRKVDIDSRDELGVLADAFNAMSTQLNRRIDELERNQAAIEEGGNLLETVLGTMIEGVVAVDRRQTVLFANKAGCRLLDADARHVVGRPFWEVTRESQVQQVVADVLERDTQKRIEFRMPRTGCTLDILGSRLPGSPSPGAVLVLHDVTELRRLETVRRDFVSNVSHELKTPLTAIRASAETLGDGAMEDPEHGRRFLAQIEEQADRLNALIMDLLSLARIESGEEAFDIQPVPVQHAVDDCLQNHATVAESKGIELSSEPIPESLEVLADAHELCSLLDNLVENAINYTPSGGRVTIRCTHDGLWARIDVEDTGIGIPEEHQSRIFERFYRVDKARSRALGGTGLGLSIVKHRVQAFGGRIELASEPGKGSTFSVFLPLATESRRVELAPG